MKNVIISNIGNEMIRKLFKIVENHTERILLIENQIKRSPSHTVTESE